MTIKYIEVLRKAKVGEELIFGMLYEKNPNAKVPEQKKVEEQKPADAQPPKE